MFTETQDGYCMFKITESKDNKIYLGQAFLKQYSLFFESFAGYYMTELNTAISQGTDGANGDSSSEISTIVLSVFLALFVVLSGVLGFLYLRYRKQAKGYTQMET